MIIQNICPEYEIYFRISAPRVQIKEEGSSYKKLSQSYSRVFP